MNGKDIIGQSIAKLYANLINISTEVILKSMQY